MPPTILCAQEDRNLFRIHEQALQAEGFHVLAAHDGEQALALAAEERPDLLLLDVLLPKRDGFQVLEAIRAFADGEEPVPGLLLCPGRISPQYRERIAAFGGVTMLSKPVALEALLEQVRALAKPAPSRVERPAAEGAGLSGSLREVDFAALLHQLHGLRASGVLLLQNGKKKKAIQFTDGYPMAVKSNLITECLGNMLVGRGELDETALQESLRRVRSGEGLQGEILVAMEVLDEVALAEALRAQAETKLFEIFRWLRGRYQLQPDRTLQRGNALSVDRSPANIVIEGARKHVPLRRVDAFLMANARRFVVRGESPFYRFQSIDLSRQEEHLVSGLDGSRPLAEFVESPEPVRRTLYGLLMTELLELRGEADAVSVPASVHERAARPRADEEPALTREQLTSMVQRMRGQNHYEVLGLPTTADDDSVRRAHARWVSRVHPDRFANASGPVRQLADEIFRLITRAQEQIGDAARRAAYAEELKRGAKEQKSQARGRKALAAETAFQQGEAALRVRNYEEALALFGRAMEQFPEEGEYHAHYGWCLHLCHPDNVVMLQEAMEHVQRGIKLARDREKPYLFLGRLYKVVGKASAAEKMFTRAVQIRPDCVEAMRELRLMNMRRDKAKGLLGRLLRR